MNITHNCREWLDDAGECTICEVADKPTEVSKTCDTCRFWFNEEGTTLEIKSYRECNYAGGEEPDGLCVSDGEPFNSGVVATGPKFGCVHWEAKP